MSFRCSPVLQNLSGEQSWANGSQANKHIISLSLSSDAHWKQKNSIFDNFQGMPILHTVCPNKSPWKKPFRPFLLSHSAQSLSVSHSNASVSVSQYSYNSCNQTRNQQMHIYFSIQLNSVSSITTNKTILI